MQLLIFTDLARFNRLEEKKHFFPLYLLLLCNNNNSNKSNRPSDSLSLVPTSIVCNLFHLHLHHRNLLLPIPMADPADFNDQIATTFDSCVYHQTQIKSGKRDGEITQLPDTYIHTKDKEQKRILLYCSRCFSLLTTNLIIISCMWNGYLVVLKELDQQLFLCSRTSRHLLLLLFFNCDVILVNPFWLQDERDEEQS